MGTVVDFHKFLVMTKVNFHEYIDLFKIHTDLLRIRKSAEYHERPSQPLFGSSCLTWKE